MDGYDKQSYISNRLPMPVDILADTAYLQSITGETLQLYYWNSGTLTQDAGQAAGTVVIARFAYTGILDSLGAMIGNNKDTSISFTTGTVLTTEVRLDYQMVENPSNATLEQVAAKVTENMDNGEYAVDYRNGVIYGKKATTGTSDTVDYKVLTQTTGGGTSVTASQDLATIGGNTVVTAGVNGLLAVGGNVAEDAADAGNPVKVGGVYNAADVELDDGDRGNLQLDINGYTKVRNKSYDPLTQADSVGVINPDSTQHVPATLVDETNITTNTTTYAYFDMDGFRNFSLQGETSGTTPTDVLTVTIEATTQDDGTAQASCVYQDVTNDMFGVASWVDTDFYAIADTVSPFKYVRVKYVTSNGGGSDADLTVYLKKLY